MMQKQRRRLKKLISLVLMFSFVLSTINVSAFEFDNTSKIDIDNIVKLDVVSSYEEESCISHKDLLLEQTEENMTDAVFLMTADYSSSEF